MKRTKLSTEETLRFAHLMVTTLSKENEDAHVLLTELGVREKQSRTNYRLSLKTRIAMLSGGGK